MTLFPHLCQVWTAAQAVDADGRKTTSYAEGSLLACRIVPRRSDGPFGPGGGYSPEAGQDASRRYYGVQVPVESEIGPLDQFTLYPPDGTARRCQMIDSPRYVASRMIVLACREVETP